jgi:hypothetical protein
MNNIYTQDSIPNVTEFERVFDKYTGKVYDGLNDAVEKVAPHAVEGFKFVVKLQIIKGIGHLIPTFLFIIFFLLLIKEYMRIENLLNQEEVPAHMNKFGGVLNESNSSFLFVMYLIICIIFFCISCFTLYSGILYLFAPEWFALQEILNLFK